MLFEDMHFNAQNRFDRVVEKLYPSRGGNTNIVFKKCTFDYTIMLNPFTYFDLLTFEDCEFNVDQVVKRLFKGYFNGKPEKKAIINGDYQFTESSNTEINNTLIKGDNFAYDSQAIFVKSSEIIGDGNLSNIRGVDLLNSTIKGEDALGGSETVLVIDSLITGNTPFEGSDGVFVTGNTRINGYNSFNEAENVFIYSPDAHISNLVPPKDSIIIAGCIDEVVGKVPKSTKLFALRQGSVPCRSIKIISADVMPPLENIDTHIAESTIQKRTEEFVCSYKG